MTAEQTHDYMRAHYWDKFDFADTLFIAEIDTVEMLRAFAAWVGNYLAPDDPAPVEALMAQAGSSRPMLAYFAMLAEKVLYDPNSPLRSDELYIPVLEAQAASPLLDEWEKIAPLHDLRMAQQNRPGERANDFRYTLGRRQQPAALRPGGGLRVAVHLQSRLCDVSAVA